MVLLSFYRRGEGGGGGGEEGHMNNDYAYIVILQSVS